MTRGTLSALALTVATALFTTPANALFGASCVPNIRNCYCTFLIPCPVTDGQNLANSIRRQAETHLKGAAINGLKMPLQDAMMAMRGEVPRGIPGIDSIGIDIDGLVNGNLSSLGIPGMGGDLATQLSNLGIDGALLASIASGELGVEDMISVAEAAGLDMEALRKAGLGIDTMTALANGELEMPELLDLASRLGLEAGVLSDLGITENLIVGISRGDVDVNRIVEIARNAGLDMASLEAVGLDIETISNLPNAGPGYVASVLQRSGYDSSIVTSMGLDAGMIAEISAGQRPPSDIARLVSGTGIDPSAIILPGANGPIRVTDPDGSNAPKQGGSGMGGADFQGPQSTAPGTAASASSTPGARPKSASNTINIPVESVPGLRNALEAAMGRSSSGGTFTGDEAQTAAMCATDRALVSTDLPPNPFGDDVANIDLAISGGNLDAFPEAIGEALSAAGTTNAHNYGRSVQMRPILLKAVEAIDEFETMMTESRTLQDDWIVNDTIKGHLMTARAENASLLASLASLGASGRMTPEYISPLPILPAGSRFRENVMKSSQATAAAMAERSSLEAGSYSRSMTEYAGSVEDSREALKHYRLMSDSLMMQDNIPGLTEIIDHHEAYKNGLFDLELYIKSKLRVLYGDDSEAAWSRLRPVLVARAGGYLDGSKWTRGSEAARDLSSELTAQSATTSYGSRVLVQARLNQETGPIYSTIPDTPYAYPSIDALAGADEDPYKVKPPFVRVDDPDLSGDELSGALQYYLETLRRVAWFGEMRRGPVERTMTGAFWNEMLNHAPECLSAPVETTRQALMNRPDLFDLDRNCGHLVWSYGDVEDFIDPSHLGGADASLWRIKVFGERVRLITGGPDAVMAEIRDVLADISSSSATSLLQMQGFPNPAEHLDLLSEQLSLAFSSKDFSANAGFVSRPPR